MLTIERNQKSFAAQQAWLGFEVGCNQAMTHLVRHLIPLRDFISGQGLDIVTKENICTDQNNIARLSR